MGSKILLAVIYQWESLLVRIWQGSWQLVECPAAKAVIFKLTAE